MSDLPTEPETLPATLEQFAEPDRVVALKSAVRTYGMLTHPASLTEQAAAEGVVEIAGTYLAFLEGEAPR